MGINILSKDSSDFKIECYGNISRSFELFNHKLSDVKNLSLDLKKIVMINSLGVAAWIEWTNRYAKNIKISLHNCPPFFINQASTVSNFFGKNFIVESLFFPYVCDSCDWEKSILLHNNKDFFYETDDEPSSYELPETMKCINDDEEMISDVVLERFFNFLKK